MHLQTHTNTHKHTHCSCLPALTVLEAEQDQEGIQQQKQKQTLQADARQKARQQQKCQHPQKQQHQVQGQEKGELQHEGKEEQRGSKREHTPPLEPCQLSHHTVADTSDCPLNVTDESRGDCLERGLEEGEGEGQGQKGSTSGGADGEDRVGKESPGEEIGYVGEEWVQVGGSRRGKGSGAGSRAGRGRFHQGARGDINGLNGGAENAKPVDGKGGSVQGQRQRGAWGVPSIVHEDQGEKRVWSGSEAMQFREEKGAQQQLQRLEPPLALSKGLQQQGQRLQRQQQELLPQPLMNTRLQQVQQHPQLQPPLQQQQPADHEQRALVGCLPQDGRSDDAEQGEAELSWMPQFNAFVQVCPLLRAVADLVLNRYVGLYTDNGWNLEGRGRLDADL